MDTQTFANTIRQKYPDGVANDGTAYKAMPDQELVNRIVTKYPVYQSQITDYKVPDNSFNAALFNKGPETAAGNKATQMQGDVGPAVANAVHDVHTSPVDVAKGFAKNVASAGVALDTGIQNIGKAVLHPIDTILGRPANPNEGVSSFNSGSPENVALKQTLTPSNHAQETGGHVADAAGLFVGGADKGVIDVTKAGLEKAAPIIDKAGKVVKDVVSPVTDFAKDVAGGIKSKISTAGLSKTPEEILATPQPQAYKLNTAERDYYKAAQKDKLTSDFEKQGTMSDKEFQARQAQLEAEHHATTARVNTELAANTTKSEKDIANLSKEVDQTAYNKTIELKPKAIQALSNQSKTYRNLIEEDLAPHADLPVFHDEISDVINNALPDNPAMAEKIKNQLKLKQFNEQTGEISADSKDPTMKIGDLYRELKGIKADNSKPGLRGNRVYTADDMARDKVVSGLSDLLKEKGVDLSRANDFWRQWAPLRDKIVTKLKPFDANNLETKTFSEILKSSGEDIHNQNFIKSFENVLGEPITTETQAVMSRLSSAEKAKVAAKVDAEMQTEEAKLTKKYGIETIAGEKQTMKSALSSAKGSAEEKLKDEQFQIDRLAKRRTVIKRILQGLGVLGANEAVKATTGHSVPFVPTI